MSTTLSEHARLVPSLEDSDGDLLLLGADTPNTWKPAALMMEMGIDFDVFVVAWRTSRRSRRTCS